MKELEENRVNCASSNGRSAKKRQVFEWVRDNFTCAKARIRGGEVNLLGEKGRGRRSSRRKWIRAESEYR